MIELNIYQIAGEKPSDSKWKGSASVEVRRSLSDQVDGARLDFYEERAEFTARMATVLRVSRDPADVKLDIVFLRRFYRGWQVSREYRMNDQEYLVSMLVICVIRGVFSFLAAAMPR
jgi:hypothetical protein